MVYQYRDVPDVCRAVRNSLHCCVEFKGFSKTLSLSFHCVAVLSLSFLSKKTFTFFSLYGCVEFRKCQNIATISDFHGSVVYEV